MQQDAAADQMVSPSENIKNVFTNQIKRQRLLNITCINCSQCAYSSPHINHVMPR